MAFNSVAAFISRSKPYQSCARVYLSLPFSRFQPISHREMSTYNNRFNGGDDFPQEAKEKCWESAKVVPGMNKDRWRLDVQGNPVCKVLNQGFLGSYCYEFHSIDKDKELTAENCQILSAPAARGLKPDTFTQQDMKLVEIALYNDSGSSEEK
ncbi:PREDICTED: uncharacterized protein LOC104746973 isoform X1 [Camelina sativa]|uniref:Uncharacterized protein LOC104746973 isoform X1 n=1 Tax=Camelina sativa TaxID=90675 RepID=A0ABM0W7K6_CAMSA|nr:PREDICTED: uncharacterized protein LOC104746973 isoform X1 [Camelina sativa]